MNEPTTVDMQQMRAAAEQASTVMRVLANPDRLLLLCQLSQGEMSVSVLEALVQVQQPTLSQQLGVLRMEGLVKQRREGKRMFYSISDERVLTLLQTLYQLYCPRGAVHTKESGHEHPVE